MASFNDLLRHFRVMKYYIIASTLLFAVGIGLGFVGQGFEQYLNQQMDGMGALAQMIEQSAHPRLGFFVVIFFNNAIKSIFFIFLGAFLGLLPLFVLAINGMILGFVLSQAGGNAWLMFVQGILPHGILELPAIIVACAYGIRFGVLTMRGLLNLFRPTERKSVGIEIVQFLKLTLPLMILLVSALLIAAIIESTISYALVRS